MYLSCYGCKPMAGQDIHARVNFLRGLGQDDGGFEDYGPAVPDDFEPLNDTQLLAEGYGPGSFSSPIPTIDEPVSEGGLVFPPGTTGIDPQGNPVNSSGQILQPSGAVITPGAAGAIASSVSNLVKAISTPAGLTVFPARPGQSLPPGAIGFNAAGQPVNSLGQVISSSSILQSLTNNPLLLVGLAVGAAVILAKR